MTRKILALLLCFVLLLAQFGCGVKEQFRESDDDDRTEREEHESSSAEPVPPPSDPVQFLRTLGEESGFQNAFSELELTASVEMEGATFQRLQQNYRGIPVYGKSVTYVTDETGEMLSVTGNVEDVDETIAMAPSIREDQLEDAVRSCLDGSDWCGTLLRLVMDDVKLCVYPSDTGDRLAYSMTVAFAGEDGNSYCDMVLDAQDGSLLMMDSRLNSAEYISGPLSGQETEYSNVEYGGSDIRSQLYDPNRGIVAFTANHIDTFVYESSVMGYSDDSNKIITIPDYAGHGDPIVWTTGEVPDAVAVDAYVNTQIAYDYFASVLGNTSTDGNGNNSVEIYVGMNYDFDGQYGKFIPFYNNAASDTNPNEGVTRLYYGLSTSGSFIEAAASLDTVAHEYMHGVESSHSDMLSQGESGALKEALSDIFGELTEAWHYGTSPDWVHGSRNMTNPSANDYPALYEGRNWGDTGDPNIDNDWGYIHNNSTVISHAAYLMWASSAFNNTELAQLWYRAMLMMPTNCNFHQARALVELAARTMEMDEDQLLEIAIAFDSVGLFASETPVYQLQQGGTLTVLDANDEPYDNYTVSVRKYAGNAIGTYATGDSLLFPILGTDVDTIEVSDPEPLVLNLEPGSYCLDITDLADPEKSVRIFVEITSEAEQESNLTLYTDFGEPNAASVQFSMHEYTRTLTTTDGVAVYEFHLIYPLFEGDSPAEVLLNEGYARILEEWSGELGWTPDELYEEWEDNLESAAFPFVEELIGEVTYNGNGCFALVETGYLWGGGAHPNHYTNNYLYDIATGSELTLDQILVGAEEEIDEVLAYYAAEAGIGTSVDLYHLKENCAFALTEEGLSFHYQDPIMYRVQGDILIPFTNEDLYVISAGELIRSW